VERGDLEGALEAYEAVRRTDGADADLLARVAVLLLEREVRGDDPARRRAALLQLALAGTRGEPVLTRLSREPGRGPARLGALKVLARRGREQARLALRALADDDDLEVVAASVLGMDPALDRARLLTLLSSTHAGVRAAAAGALAPAADEPAVARALAEAARVDPEPSVRAAAVRALGRGGDRAVDALRERLGDADSRVRLAAVGALVQADRDRARLLLGSLLEVAPSPAGIEAARWLAQDAPRADAEASAAAVPSRAAAARLFLRRALFADDPSLRSQAGVALAGLPADAEAPVGAIREALAREADPDVRLSLARALARHDAAAAAAAFEGLLGAEGMPRVQAAAQLAARGHEAARALLAEVLRSDAAVVLRRTAARALAREAMAPDAVREALRDDEALVRIYAAGGILAAAAAG
jgi:HEAT repeat protein